MQADPSENPNQAGSALSVAQVLRILDHIEGQLIFLLDPSDKAVFVNAPARALIDPDCDVAAWLSGAHFHDPYSRARLPCSAAPLPRLRAVRDASAKMPEVELGYLGADGVEHVIAFLAAPLGPLPAQDSPDANAPHDAGLWLIQGKIGGHSAAHPAENAWDDAESAHAGWHELGNIFGIIQIVANGLSGTVLDPAMRARIDDLTHATRRGTALLDRMSGAAQQDADTAPPLDLSEIALRAIDVFSRVLPPSIDLTKPQAETVLIHDCSAPELEAAVIALLSVSRMYLSSESGMAGSIEVSTDLKDHFARLSINSWLSDADGEHRAQQSAGAEADKTLAEALQASVGRASKLVEAAGGRFDAHPDHSNGFFMIADFPLFGGPAPSNTDAQPASKQLESASSQLAGYHLCLGDPDATHRHAMADMLRQQGAQVHEVETVAAFRDLLRHGPMLDVAVVATKSADGATAEDWAAELRGDAAGGANGGRVIILTGARGSAHSPSRTKAGMVLSKSAATDTLVNAILLRPPLAQVPRQADS